MAQAFAGLRSEFLRSQEDREWTATAGGLQVTNNKYQSTAAGRQLRLLSKGTPSLAHPGYAIHSGSSASLFSCLRVA